MLSKVLSLGLSGVNGYEVQTECYIGTGLPAFDLVGLPDASVKEARERVRAAIKNCGFRFPVSRIIVNLAPAGTKKSGTLYDLPILLSILAASEQVKLPKKRCAFLGELSLEGALRAVPGVLPMALAAKRLGYEELYVPEDNAREATLAGGLAVYGVKDIRQLTAHLTGQTPIDPAPIWQPEHKTQQLLDFKDVKGQENAKRALEIAAAGGHNLIMTGPPGSGKTMLASRMPGIMCPLNEAEQLEVASIRSLCGILPQYGITDMPPFEAPHHTASTAALVGGGSGIAVPGAITRAHRGILFLDEAPEFSARALQTLREPLESGYVALSRSKGSTYYPASFQLIMAANPCPCGYYYGTGERCACREKDRIRYFSRLSGPILDRVDIQMAVPPVSRIAAQSEPIGESSAGIQARVIRARQVAKDRFRQYGWVCNAQASGKWLHANTSLKAMELVNRALSNHQLTLRGADRAMRLSWTLADLAGRVSPTEQDVHQGIEMRTRMT